MNTASIKDYIYEHSELEYMPFMVVYSTIMALIKDGLVKPEAFENVQRF